MAFSVIVRTIATWSAVVMTVIFIALRVGGETHWKWIGISLPLIIFDGFCALVLCRELWRHVKQRRAHLQDVETSAWRKLWFLLVLTVKVIAIILLCLRLDGSLETSYVVVCIPLWIFLLAITGDLLQVLIKGVIQHRQDQRR